LTGRKPAGLGTDPPSTAIDRVMDWETGEEGPLYPDEPGEQTGETTVDITKTGRAQSLSAGAGLLNWLRGLFGFTTGAKGLGGPVMTLLVLAGLGVGGYYAYKAISKARAKPKKNAGWPRDEDEDEPDYDYDDEEESDL
jgi:uncharacterized membrane protein YebE (DUF533 family)